MLQKTVLCLLTLGAIAGAATVRSGTAADPAGLTAVVDQFRADLGDPNNANLAGSQITGRREINWDGPGGGVGAPLVVGPTPFLNFANRGSINTTPGTGFSISSGGADAEFANINPTYPEIFQSFSGVRLFAVLGSNVMDMHFAIPGDPSTPAVSSGFGVVFADVDLPDTTTMEYFDFSGNSLGIYSVPALNNGLSFLGVSFDTPVVNRVRITLGNAALGPNDAPPGTDVVAMDDFVFGEPNPVPEPGTTTLLAAGAAALLLFRNWRNR